VVVAQDKRAQRVRSVRRSKGVPKNYERGDCVLLLPPKRGRCGRPVGPKRIVCRVVGMQRFGGLTKFKLRCNAGIIKGYQFAASLEKAPAAAAAKLHFSGTDTASVPVVGLDKAWAAEDGAAATIKCRCRSKCGKSCACRKSGALCSRNCGCSACSGANCGNHS
jgi:hypothetical protein